MKLNNFVFPTLPNNTILLKKLGEGDYIQKKLVILEKKYGNSDSHNGIL